MIRRFCFDMQLNLYEHQSTWNPNMPLRFLMYVAKEYQMLVRNQTLYASAGKGADTAFCCVL